jgi:RecG-like helicase
VLSARRQSGLAGLRLADPLADGRLLVLARETAARLLSTGAAAAFAEPLLLRRDLT